MTGPDARTTQIYINTGDQPVQDARGFAPLGTVVEGMGVVDNLYSEYGENSGGGMRAGRQGKLFEEGNAYLDREFSLLDKLIKASGAGAITPKLSVADHRKHALPGRSSNRDKVPGSLANWVYRCNFPA